MKIKEAYAVYTGGGIWVFYGEVENGNHFLMSDDGFVLILDASAEDLDESTYVEWQEEHLVKELEHEERYAFCVDVLDWLKQAPDEYRGGIFDSEIEAYKTWMNSDEY